MEKETKKMAFIIGSRSVGKLATVLAMDESATMKNIIHLQNDSMSTDKQSRPGLGETPYKSAGAEDVAALSALSALVAGQLSTPARAGYRARRKSGSNQQTPGERQMIKRKNRRHKANKAARRARISNRKK